MITGVTLIDSRASDFIEAYLQEHPDLLIWARSHHLTRRELEIVLEEAYDLEVVSVRGRVDLEDVP